MSIGIPSSTRTTNSTLTRNQLIEQAYKEIGVLADGERLKNELLTDGALKLNLIIRELDVYGKWLWAISGSPSSLTLSANTWVYTANTGVQTNILELTKVMYRDSQAADWPVTILTTEGYAGINSKLQTGDPCQIYLTNEQDLSLRTLYVWPALQNVNSQSVVTGSDGQTYACIRSHTADSTNEPVTGANYLQYWTLAGSGPSAWVSNSTYTAPQQLLYWYKRPLYDFTAADDNPDLPPQWTLYLLFRLAELLGPSFGMPLDERSTLAQEAQASYDRIFPSIKPSTTDYHNRASYM